ncbi:transcriptional regulator [Lactobacillus ultunensis DSM 16047]|nr:transcriptional regulator [Lactobacillus ultunensis DSM 16047]
MRTGELKRQLPGISQRILTKQLNELEQEKIIKKKIYPEVPPKVEYCLTDNGRALREVLLVMSKWGMQQTNLQNNDGHHYKILDKNLYGFTNMNNKDAERRQIDNL